MKKILLPIGLDQEWTKKKEWTITLIIGGNFILLKIFSSYSVFILLKILLNTYLIIE